MAIIIVTNCLANVFNRKSVNHIEFRPILKWIIKGKGIIVYGGSKYLRELKRTPKYLPIIRYLKDINKVYIGNCKRIDKLQETIEANRVDKDFDDPHLPAIVIETKCMLICSEDKRSIPFVKNSALYPKGFNIPLYYTSSKNKNLLCDKYIDNNLKPLCKLKKTQIAKITKLLV